MRTLIIGVSLVLALSQAGPASAGPSANEVMPGCRLFVAELTRPHDDFKEWINVGRCIGIIQGLVDAADTQGTFCAPGEVTNGQLVRVVVNYIDRHPEKMHMPFTHLAAEALLKAWPCKP